MKKLLECQIRQCQMLIDYFQNILDHDCEELRECVRQDLEYDKFEDIDKNILFSGEPRENYWKLNSGESKTRNWLLLNNLKEMNNGNN